MPVQGRVGGGDGSETSGLTVGNDHVPGYTNIASLSTIHVDSSRVANGPVPAHWVASAHHVRLVATWQR